MIFTTSTVNNEGKSFFSINMALTMANTDKRVLLIGADIRNPKTELGLINQKKKVVVFLISIPTLKLIIHYFILQTIYS